MTQVHLYCNNINTRTYNIHPGEIATERVNSWIDEIRITNTVPHVIFDQPIVYALVHACTVDASEGAWEAWETLSLHTTEKQARDAIVEHFTPKDGENGTPYLDGTFKVIMMTVES